MNGRSAPPLKTELADYHSLMRVDRSPAAAYYGGNLVDCSERIVATTRRFIVVGDTQRTLPIERLLLREQNDPERNLLINAIASERPDLLVHLGDVVNYGSSVREWGRFDDAATPLRRMCIPIFPVVGNHDYWSSSSAALRNAHVRFPMLNASHWYSRRYEHLSLIWLDSNRAHLSRKDWAGQERWLKDELGRADGDLTVKGVLVFCHHPPFTNSKVTSDEIDVQQAFLPAFLAARKTVALIAGHAHAYEHFEKEGKTFIVSGGGGGPRVRLLSGVNARHEDLYRRPYPRPFHYLILRQSAKGLQIEVKGFDKGEKDVRPLDLLTLGFPNVVTQ